MNALNQHRFTALIGLAVIQVTLLSGCGQDVESDAFGNFEATEITVSSQVPGRLLSLQIEEGDYVEAGRVVGLVDTTQLRISRRTTQAQQRSLIAQRRATLAQLPEIEAQIAAIQSRLNTAENELARTRRLLDMEAATTRELEQRQTETETLRHQIEQARARQAAVRVQAESMQAQVEQVASSVEEIDQRLLYAHVTNPRSGRVLTVVTEPGESVGTGSPLYLIASLDTLTLRAYITGAQLPEVTLGMSVDVLVDSADGGLRTRPGTVTRIADQAQFTPTPIQTRENRVELVYAIDVRVPNADGLLKIGMPGEVRIRTADR